MLVIHTYTWNHSTLTYAKTEWLEIELFDHWTVFKQMTDVRDT